MSKAIPAIIHKSLRARPYLKSVSDENLHIMTGPPIPYLTELGWQTVCFHTGEYHLYFRLEPSNKGL